MSIKSVNALSHYTDWTIAHVHAGASGMERVHDIRDDVLVVAQNFSNQALESQKLATWHFWLGTLGILAYIIPIYVAGLTQGLMWRAFTPEGNLAYPDFVETVNATIPMWWTRVGGGSVLYVAGIVSDGGQLCHDVAATRPAKYEVPVIEAAPLTTRRIPILIHRCRNLV